MTVGMQVHKAMGMMKTLSGNFHTFALDTMDPAAKQMFTSFSKQLDTMMADLQQRINYMEGQEPQYKMENMAQEMLNQQQAKQQRMQTEE